MRPFSTCDSPVICVFYCKLHTMRYMISCCGKIICKQNSFGKLKKQNVILRIYGISYIIMNLHIRYFVHQRQWLPYHSTIVQRESTHIGYALLFSRRSDWDKHTCRWMRFTFKKYFMLKNRFFEIQILICS